MENLEKQLADEKARLDSMKAPDDLEMKLTAALNTVEPRRKRKVAFIWKVAIAAIILVSVISYNFNALAYYSKKILGFDDMLSGPLKDLNENEMGQVVDKSVELEGGTTLTIHGIMTDVNQLILFYTLRNPNGIDEENFISFASITGFLTNSSISGGPGYFNEDETEVKGMLQFEPVNPFAKKLTLVIWQFTEDDESTVEITFDHDPNKAMQANLTQPIKETVSVDSGTITFDVITASPTVTVLEGSIDVENLDKFEGAPLHGIRLIANGNSVGSSSYGVTTGPTGTTFDIQYHTLPEELDSLQVMVRKFIGYEEINKQIQFGPDKNEFFTLYEEEEMIVKQVEETSRGIEVTIATDEYVLLDGVSIVTKKGTIPLQTTIGEDYSMQINGVYMKERTLVFDTTETPEQLSIEGIHFLKTYNKTIDIPVK
ncbi:DUF4179 domain-containing protein [Pseudogracilibacillus auburnensis]|uniref:Uncharacterized protein DUF4179 n=1 Tax=Pseudogracilibacillus auburnensis TaxID=1494959 RepID=A0A2V3VSC0_9BACI|nr:DUF4179 domain-containing protein [Pseudogracilibacillus auburnensis]PXW84792.1 uncharacterized protein DUF4179 [Pseudogracilibacillus auburnensis]